MTRFLLKKVSIVLFVAALVALLFFVFIPYEARAAETLNISLTFDTVPMGGFYYQNNHCFIVKEYKGRLNGEGDLVPLVDSVTKRVTAANGDYSADGSEVLVAYNKDAQEEIVDGPVYIGEVCFKVSMPERLISPLLSAEMLSKVYGDGSRSALVWEETTDGNTVVVTFTSEGLAATALPGTYELVVQSVMSNGFDMTENYTVTPMQAEESTQEARLIVDKKPLVVSFDSEVTVPFNNFRTAELPIEAAGVNGETVTVYFRLTEENRAKDLLTIGEHYALEYYTYSIRDKDGQEVEADCYSVTADLSEISTVAAVSGPITLYQGDIAAYQGRTDCVQLDTKDFTYTYLDEFISDYDGALLFEGVQLYDGIEVDLRCSIVCEASVIPCGTYTLTLLGVEQDGFEELTLDAGFKMFVTAYELTYTEKSDCQYGNKTFNKQVKLSIPDREGEYTFTLSATIAESTPVGAEVAYTGTSAISKEDPNVILTYDEARVVIVKRSSGVAFRQADDLSAVYYRAAYTVSTLTFTDNGKTITLPAEDILYSYSISGDSYTSGLPTVVGTYKVKCSVAATSSYTTEPAIYDLAIVPRPVLVVYKVADATKKYGAVYTFSTNTMQLMSIYSYDTESKTADRAVDYCAEPYKDTVSVLSGISCEGAAASAELGAYPITISVAPSGYDVKAVLLYDMKAGEETNELTVVKSDVPPDTTILVSYKGRSVTVTAASGPVLVQISEKSDFSVKTEASAETGTVNFTNRKYGQVYYVRACISDAVHYETANGNWSDRVTVAIPFLALSVTLQEDSVTDTQASFTVAELENSAAYVVEYKVGSNGKWKEGTTAEGLAAGKTQTVYFRAKAGDVKGQETSVPVTTLCAPVKEDDVKMTYDRETGVLTVTSSVEVEMRLLNKEGEVVFDWTKEDLFSSVPRDAEYIVQVRNAADGERSAVTEIHTDTYRKGPFTILTYLSDWFLVWIVAVMIVVLVIIIICFVRLKRKWDRRLLGGKDEN